MWRYTVTCVPFLCDVCNNFDPCIDHIYEQILYSSNPDLSEARTILQNVTCRRLYKCVGQTTPESHLDISQAVLTEWGQEVSKCKPNSTEVDLLPDDFVVNVVHMNYGMKKKNPVNNVYFYCKGTPQKAIKIRKNQVSKMLPDIFAEQLIRVYCKKTDEKSLMAAKKYFVQWCMKRNFSKPQDSDVIAPELTPLKLDWNDKDADEEGAEKRSEKKAVQKQLFK